MQIQKPAVAQAAAAPAMPVQAGCTGWLCEALQIAEPECLVFAAMPGGAQNISGTEYGSGELDYMALMSSLWVGGDPVALDGYGNPRPWPGPGFVCAQIEIDTAYYYAWPGRVFTAVLTGAAHWVAAWDTPFVEDPQYSYPGYHRVQVLGSVLRVDTSATDGSIELVQTMTAQAVNTSTGAVIMELVFKAHRHPF